MNISNEQREPREAVLTVELDDADVEPYLDQAYRQAVRRMAVPGFRKGKAPRRVVEQMYGRERLLNQAFDALVNDFTTKAVESEGITLGGVPSVQVSDYEPFRFVAVVPLPPSVDLGDFESVRVPKEEAAVADEDVEATIEQMRAQQGVWEPVDGAARMGDLVNLTVVGWVEEGGERHEFVRSEDMDYIPREGGTFPVPGMDEALAGLPQGTPTSFEIAVPADFRDPAIAGKTARFEAEMHSVKRRSLPEVDDEFAKSVGEGYESAEALREQVRANLLAHEERLTELRHQEAALSKLVEGATVAISPLIVDRELEHYVRGRRDLINSGRASFEEYREYLAWQGLEDAEIYAQARPRVEERLKRGHALLALTERWGIEASDEEVDEEIDDLASVYGDQAEAQRKRLADAESRESIRRRLTQRKTLEALSAMALGASPELARAEQAETEAGGAAGAA